MYCYFCNNEIITPRNVRNLDGFKHMTCCSEACAKASLAREIMALDLEHMQRLGVTGLDTLSAAQIEECFAKHAERWDGLPETIRAGILAMDIDTSGFWQ